MLDKTIECDDCKEEVQVKDVKVKEVLYKGDRNKRVWNCPKCNHEYLITITNKESRELSDLIEADALTIKRIHDNANWLGRANRLSDRQMDKDIKDTESIGVAMKVNKDTLDKLSKVLIDEYNKEEELK